MLMKFTFALGNRGRFDDWRAPGTGASACSTCSASSCVAGQYLSGCGGASGGTCAACPSGSYSSGSGVRLQMLRFARLQISSLACCCFGVFLIVIFNTEDFPGMEAKDLQEWVFCLMTRMILK